MRKKDNILLTEDIRVVIPFYGKKILHPKIVKQVFDAMS